MLERALELTGRIYDAVVEPDAWHDFLVALSEELGGAAIQLSLRLPHEEPSPDSFVRVGLDEGLHAVFMEHVRQGLPWARGGFQEFRGRFAFASEVVPDEDIADTSLYREYMKPQGLAADWPLGHLIAVEGGRPVAGLAIYRREGGRPIDADDLALLDSLVPHLARAYALHCQLRDVRQQRRALTEVIDRLPHGVVLVDAGGRAVLMNRGAETLLTLSDGLRLERGRPVAQRARENRTLQDLIQKAVQDRAEHGFSSGEVMAVSRPSGRRPFPVMVGPLLAASGEDRTDEARAVIFVSDPEGSHVGTTAVLETLYGLTTAEAELVRLVAEGHSLDEVAAERGVTMNTVRSQLKQVFAKTDTSRQGELIHLVLTGVASIWERDGDADRSGTSD